MRDGQLPLSDSLGSPNRQPPTPGNWRCRPRPVFRRGCLATGRQPGNRRGRWRGRARPCGSSRRICSSASITSSRATRARETELQIELLRVGRKRKHIMLGAGRPSASPPRRATGSAGRVALAARRPRIAADTRGPMRDGRLPRPTLVASLHRQPPTTGDRRCRPRPVSTRLRGDRSPTWQPTRALAWIALLGLAELAQDLLERLDHLVAGDTARAKLSFRLNCFVVGRNANT